MLTDLQEKFAFNVAVKGMNYTQAWIDAGYSDNYSMTVLQPHASKLAAKDKIKARIKELRNELEGPDFLSQSEYIRGLTEIYRANLTDFIDKDGNIKLDGGSAKALLEYNVDEIKKLGRDALVQGKKIKLVDKLQAGRDIAKVKKWWSDDTNINIDNRTVNIIVESKDDRDNLNWIKNGMREQTRSHVVEIGESSGDK